MGRFAQFLGVALEGQKEMTCSQIRLKYGECPDICIYKHGPYCNRAFDDTPPTFLELTEQEA